MKDLKIFAISDNKVSKSFDLSFVAENELLAQYVVKEFKTMLYSNKFANDSYGTLVDYYIKYNNKALDLVVSVIANLEKKIITRQENLDIPKSIKLQKLEVVSIDTTNFTVNLKIINQENKPIYLEV
jgi:hypothetical protein